MSATVTTRRPTRDLLVDAAFAGGLATIACVGFRTTFGGSRYLVVALVAVLAGTATAYGLVRFKVRPLLAVPVTLGVFVLAGAVAVPDHAVAGFLPGPEVPSALLDGLVNGWARLLTAAPPVGTSDNLLVIPYACGFFAGFAGLLLAQVRRLVLLAVLPALVVTVVGILWGTDLPASLLVQGAAFALTALAWASIRSSRDRIIRTHGTSHVRVIGVIGMLAFILLGAVVVGPHLPGVADADRYVLRDHTVPPFDPRAYPSPLSSFRKYVKDDTVKEEVVLRVSGLPKGAAIRTAVMDDYDGVVWNVTSGGSTSSGTFERIGQETGMPVSGDVSDTKVEIEALTGPWVPTVGSTDTITWGGDRAQEMTDAFRFNRTTGMGATPLPLRQGDEYVLHGAVATDPDRSAAKTAPVVDGAVGSDLVELPDAFKAKAAEITAGATTPFDQAEALESFLAKNGYYSNGNDDKYPSPPGHSIARLSYIIGNGGELGVGDEEQYAATMAVLARTLGLPARVVIGFKTASDGSDGPIDVKSGDASAWVEIPFAGIGWVPFFPKPDKKPNLRSTVTPQPSKSEAQQPPPSSIYIPPVTDQEEPLTRDTKARDSGGFNIPTWAKVAAGVILVPLLLIALFSATVIGLKRRRAARRRTSGTPTQRISGGWHEVLDRARDLRQPVPTRSTRREIATSLEPVGSGGVALLAHEADDATFGPEDASDEAAARYWAQVDAELDAMLAPLTVADGSWRRST